MKLSGEDMIMFDRIKRQYPEFVRFIERWWMQELVALPNCGTNFERMAGRVQVLTELKDKLYGPESLSKLARNENELT